MRASCASIRIRTSASSANGRSAGPSTDTGAWARLRIASASTRINDDDIEALLAFLATLLVQRQDLIEARELTRQEAETSRRVQVFLTEVFENPDRWKAGAERLTAMLLLDRDAARIDTELA